MAVIRMDILKLYKLLLKESSKFPSYNYRMYALRRIRDKFRENQHLNDPNRINSMYKDGIVNLQMIKRQVIINTMYNPERLVIEESDESKK